WGGARHGHLIWEPLSHSRVRAILHNPAYAGAYVYGRTKTRGQSLPGEEPRIKGRTQWVRPEGWAFLLPAQHPRQLPLERYRQKQRRVDENRTTRTEDRRGAPREGAARLQGLVRCGRCGHRMTVRYFKDGTIPSYGCRSIHTRYAGATCQTMRGDEIDTAGPGALLESRQPTQLQASSR